MEILQFPSGLLSILQSATFPTRAGGVLSVSALIGELSVLGSLHTGRPKIPWAPLEINFLDIQLTKNLWSLNLPPTK